MNKYMEIANECAKNGMNNNEGGPFGAVIVDKEGNIIAKGNNTVIKNSIVLNNVYIGDNTVIENCIVESRDVIRANSTYIGSPDNIRVVVEKNDRYMV